MIPRQVAAMGLLILAGTLATCVSCAPSWINYRPVGELAIEDDLLRLMDTRHEQLETERVVALFGRVVGLVVVVEGFDATSQTLSTSTRAEFSPHRYSRIVGYLHNHPSGGCRPSDTDIRTLYNDRRYVVAIASCGEGRFGYVLKGDGHYHERRVR